MKCRVCGDEFDKVPTVYYFDKDLQMNLPVHNIELENDIVTLCKSCLASMMITIIYDDREHYSFERPAMPYKEDMEQVETTNIVCPKCSRSDYIRSFETDFGIKNSGYEYKCINCNTYIGKRTTKEDKE